MKKQIYQRSFIHSTELDMAASIEELTHKTTLNEATAALCMIASGIYRLHDDLQQQHDLLETISRNLEEEDNSLVATALRDIDRTLFDTLASYKTGAALDAIARIPDLFDPDEE